MKRIIEIPDKVVEAIQNGEDYRYDIHTAIAQSVPYNPTGDCISREDLKKALDKKALDLANGGTIFIESINRIIDNAQAVEFSLLPLSGEADNAYMRGYEVGKAEGILKANTRPQGEYVDISKLRLMTVEECAGHTIEYAMGWKACVEWIKKGGAK